MDDQLRLATTQVKLDEIQEEELWGAFNDPGFFEPKFASGEIHEMLREKILEEPLFTSPLPGPAKRYVEYYNIQRAEAGLVPKAGNVVLRMQRVTRYPWRSVQGAEYDDIATGKEPNGR